MEELTRNGNKIPWSTAPVPVWDLQFIGDEENLVKGPS
jgi:hypothetical protein